MVFYISCNDELSASMLDITKTFYCFKLFDATSFDCSTVQEITWELQQEMMTNWVSMTCPKPRPEGLWKHEWMKHGSCSGMNRLGYFQAVIDLHATYNLQKVFNRGGMLQSPKLLCFLHLHEKG